MENPLNKVKEKAVKIIDDIKEEAARFKCQRCTRFFILSDLNEKRMCKECQEEYNVFGDKTNCDHCGNPAIYRATFCTGCYIHDFRIDGKQLGIFMQKRIEKGIAIRRFFIFLLGFFVGIFAYASAGIVAYLAIMDFILLVVNHKWLHNNRIYRFHFYIINNTFGGNIFREGNAVSEDD